MEPASPDPINSRLQRIRSHAHEKIPREVQLAALRVGLAVAYYRDGRRRERRAVLRQTSPALVATIMVAGEGNGLVGPYGVAGGAPEPLFPPPPVPVLPPPPAALWPVPPPPSSTTTVPRHPAAASSIASSSSSTTTSRRGIPFRFIPPGTRRRHIFERRCVWRVRP
ncbi:hypothetical protein U9M48_030880 [Paspalum notatum var. saurae]|uniref:Uncharacterized protein n=1 Tax=Paspalum notatum var. saurae TaxID=547442 RepID=A0AAQ3U1G8_PASNO